jgi:DNA-binding XRE family transcriptional regulator
MTKPNGTKHALKQECMGFSAKIRGARAILGWSQSDLAERVGLTQRSIYRLEQTGSEARPATALALEHVFERNGIQFEKLPEGGFSIHVQLPVKRQEAKRAARK